MGRGLSDEQRFILRVCNQYDRIQPGPMIDWIEANRVWTVDRILAPPSEQHRHQKAEAVVIYRSFTRLRLRGLITGSGRKGYTLTDAGWAWLVEHLPEEFPAEVVTALRVARAAEAEREKATEAASQERAWADAERELHAHLAAIKQLRAERAAASAPAR